jgi:hypothetical protein
MTELSTMLEAGDLKSPGFFNELKSIILKLLQSNFNELVTLLYRLDVSEEKVKKAFLVKNDEEIAEKLSHLIIERQFKKIEMRKKYSLK